MFFTKTGRVIAWLAFGFGVLRCAMGFALAGSDDNAAVAARYLAARTTGEAIDEGMMLIVFGIALGILTEISKAVSDNARTGKSA